MKNIKSTLPYIIINGLIFAVLGAIIGKNLVEIRNTRKRINNDSRALKRFIEEMAGSSPQIKIEDINACDVPEGIRKKADDPNDPDPPVLVLEIK